MQATSVKAEELDKELLNALKAANKLSQWDHLKVKLTFNQLHTALHHIGKYGGWGTHTVIPSILKSRNERGGDYAQWGKMVFDLELSDKMLFLRKFMFFEAL